MAKKRTIQNQPLAGTSAIVCGGSQGIGEATAKEVVQLGGNVCIVARNQDTLNQAAEDIRGLCRQESQWVEMISCDTTDHDALKPFLTDFVHRHGVPDYLFNVVGYAYPQNVEALQLEDFKRNMDVNYYGQLVPILILLPHFIAAKKGHIANVSSIAGYFGIAGYATYAPSKYAIVGLTDVLRHELRHYNITFSILYPPDTETPGLDLENETKPKEVALFSERAGFMTAEEVAEVFVEGVIKKTYHILPGEAKFIWRMNRFFPSLVHLIMDRDYQKARAKVGKA